MKNLNLFRLAGFGFFGAVFLSPTPGDDQNWIIEKINTTKRLTSLPFTMSAFYREMSIVEPKPTLAEQQSTFSPILPSFPLSSDQPPTDTVQLRMPVYDPSTVSRILLDNKTHEPPNTIVQQKTALTPTAAQESPDTLNSATQQEADLPQSAPFTAEGSETPVHALNSHLPGNEVIVGPSEEPEELSPPIYYVDGNDKKSFSVKISKAPLVPIITRQIEAGLDSFPIAQMLFQIQKLSVYATEHDYSNDYAFMINLGLKSGKKRFFLVDLRQRIIINSGLVAHGRGKEKFTLDKRYSNIFGSSCSSLGLYKVGVGYQGVFGESFRLVGLEKTNNNALTRAIVLHAMNCIPNDEIDFPICQSEGCPSLSPEFLESITPIIKNSIKPLLLWVFDPAKESSLMP